MDILLIELHDKSDKKFTSTDFLQRSMHLTLQCNLQSFFLSLNFMSAFFSPFQMIEKDA